MQNPTSVRVVKLNIDENRATAERFGVRSIPTLLMFKHGELVDRMVGNHGAKKLEKWVMDGIG